MSKQTIWMGIKSFFAAWALLRMTGTPTLSILSVFFYAACFVVFTKTQEYSSQSALAERAPSLMRAADCCAVLFTFLYTAGGADKISAGLTSGLFRAVILAVSAAGFFFLFRAGVRFSYLYLARRKTKKSDKKVSRYAFWLCLAGWMPYFLANFPAVMTVDSFNQYAQIIGVYAYNNHHPWVHTMIMKALYDAGEGLFGSSTAGIAVICVAQMLFMAGCVLSLTAFMEKRDASKGLLIGTVLFFMLTPYHGMFVVTLWKDIAFAGVFLLFTLSVYRLSETVRGEERGGLLARELAAYFASGFFVCLLRSNGWYAFLVTLPFLAYGLRKKLVPFLLVNAALAGCVLLVKGPVMGYFDVIAPDLVESLSIPIQQVTAAARSQDALTGEEKALLSKVADLDAAVKDYDPFCADPIKRLIRKGDPDYLEEHAGEFAQLYVKLGLRSPGAYLRAFADETSAYWHPDVFYQVIFNEGIPQNEFGLESHPIIRGRIFYKLKEIYFKLYEMIPFYGLLFSIGSYTWLLLGAGIYLLGQKDYIGIWSAAPGAAVLLTVIIATPLNADLRYAYSVLFTAPFYIWLMVRKMEDCDENRNRV